MKAFRIKVRGDNKSKSLEAMIRSHLVPRGCRELNHRRVQVTVQHLRCVWPDLSHIKTWTCQHTERHSTN